MRIFDTYIRRAFCAFAFVWIAAGGTQTVFGDTEVRGPVQGQAVYDEAGVMSASDVNAVENLTGELRQATGVTIVLVTVPNLVGETASGLATRIGSSWGVGRQGEDRGVVVVFAQSERKLWIATGYGVEGYLPDGRVGAIRDRSKLLFAGDRFSAALRQIVEDLAAASAENFGVTLRGADGRPLRAPRGRRQVKVPIWLWVLGIALFVFLAIRHPRLLLYLLISGMQGGGGGRGGFGGGGGGFGGFGGGGFGGGGAGGSV